MQNRYVGDIGDFGKYGLLRYLSGLNHAPEPGKFLRLGVVWYLVKNERHNNDGGHTGYLNDSPDRKEYRECDECLYDTLKRLVSSNNRNVLAVKQGGILHPETVFYEEFLFNHNRQEWFKEALKVTSGAELIFVDPDNGINNNAKRKKYKHTTTAELRRFIDRGQSLVIYHHSIRATNWIADKAEELKRELLIAERQPQVWALRWHRTQSRAYFIVAQPKHQGLLEAKIKRFLNSPWGKQRRRWDDPHYTLAYPPEEL